MSLHQYNSSNEITVPAPTSVTVASNSVNPIRPVGSDVTLTCIVMLSAAVDVPVTVNTVWSRPAGFRMYRSSIGNNTLQASTIIVKSFGRNNSGVYNCTATINSSTVLLNISDSSFGTLRVTTGKRLLLTDTLLMHNYFQVFIYSIMEW